MMHAMNSRNLKAGGFRVVARLSDGGVALVALADTRSEASQLACAREKETLAARLMLERWEGRPWAGNWVGVPTHRRVPRRRFRAV